MLPGRAAAFTAACLLLALAVGPGSGDSPSPTQGPLPSAAEATSTLTPTVTRREASTGNARARPENVVIIQVGDYDEDEEEEYDEASTESTAGVTTRLCNYDRCRHGQEPCAEIQRRAAPSDPCLCPGVADEGTQPDPPELLRPVSVTDKSVRLHWCEPLSTVLGYRLLLSDGDGSGGVRVIDGAQLARGPPGGQTQAGRPPTLTSQPLPPDTRLHTLSGLRSGTTYLVCVAAFNAAGVSSGLEGMAVEAAGGEEARPRAAAASGACRRFTTKPSRYMLAAIGSSVLLALLVLAVASGAGCLIARRRRRERLAGKQREAEGEAEGEGRAVTSTGASNPVYQGPAAVMPELGPTNRDV